MTSHHIFIDSTLHSLIYFCPEVGGNVFLRNIRNYLPGCAV